jgi:type IV pilus assembly protein PilP
VRRAALYVGAVVIGFGTALGQNPPAELPPASQVAPPAEGAPANAEAFARDPFRPFTLDLRPRAEEQPLTPLQRYELAQLRVVAVVLNLSPPLALLEDSSGMGYIVTPGTPVGRRNGVVTAIQPRRILVEEKTMDFYGREQPKLVVLEMPEETDVQGGSQE